MSLKFNNDTKLRKIPIYISKWNDDGVKGWRAEIPDTYENFKPSAAKDLNFEDLAFHFGCYEGALEEDLFVYRRKKDAVDAAKGVIEKHLKGKAKIWF